MDRSVKSAADSSPASLEERLLRTIDGFSLDAEIRQIAERIRQQAIAELQENGEQCEDKQGLISSLQIVKGGAKDEYLVVGRGKYGENLEFGTRNSLESPWLFPAFVTVAGSIDTCLHGALKRALRKTRRFPARR